MLLLQLDMVVSPCPEAETLQMRQWVISSILDSERAYVDILNTLQQVRLNTPPTGVSVTLHITKSNVCSIAYLETVTVSR